MNKGLIQQLGRTQNPVICSSWVWALLLFSYSVQLKTVSYLQPSAKSSQHWLISRGPQQNCSGLCSVSAHPLLLYPAHGSHNHFPSLQAALYAVPVLCRQQLATNSTHARWQGKSQLSKSVPELDVWTKETPERDHETEGLPWNMVQLNLASWNGANASFFPVIQELSTAASMQQPWQPQSQFRWKNRTHMKCKPRDFAIFYERRKKASCWFSHLLDAVGKTSKLRANWSSTANLYYTFL